MTSLLSYTAKDAQAAGPGSHDHHPEAGRVWLPSLPAGTSVMPAPGKKPAG
jgi:hypothetical protein